MPYLQITEIILVYLNLVNSYYQNDSKVLFTFALTKPFGQLFDILPKIVIFLKTFNSEPSYFEVWPTDQ